MPTRSRRSLRHILALVIATVTLLLAIPVLAPAPVLGLLPFAIAAPEITAWLIVAALAAMLLGAGGRGALSRLTRIFAAVAIGLSLVPLVQIPGTISRADAAMRSGLGAGYAAAVPKAVAAGWRRHPVALVDLLRGIPASDIRISRGIPIGSVEGVPLTLDLYRPAGAGAHPIVVQIYGGAWRAGVPADDGAYARYLAARGYLVAAIDYRHAPDWRWPAQLEDVRAAIDWIGKHAKEEGGDGSRMALIGRSSGAQLALMAAYSSTDHAIRAVVSYYGPVDLVEGWAVPPRPDPLDVRRVLENLLGGTPGEQPAAYRDASPLFLVRPRLPPTLLIYGSRDHIVLPRFGSELAARLRASGDTTVLIEIPWSEHAFDAVPNGPGGQLSLYYAERFLAWALARR